MCQREKFEVDACLKCFCASDEHSYLSPLLCHSRLSSRRVLIRAMPFVTPGSGSSLCFYLRTGYCGKLYFNIGKVAVKGLP